MCIRDSIFGCFVYFFLGGIEFTALNIFKNSSGKQEYILLNNSYVLSERFSCKLSYINIINADTSLLDVYKRQVLNDVLNKVIEGKLENKKDILFNYIYDRRKEIETPN